MKITFTQNKLKKIANDPVKCLKDMGKLRGTKFLTRLIDLRDAHTLEDVRHLPGKYHELKGERKGQWACDLDQPFRLIFKPHENPIPSTPHGQYVWIEILGVEIIEMVDYH